MATRRRCAILTDVLVTGKVASRGEENDFWGQACDFRSWFRLKSQVKKISQNSQA
jgi:hypothetical protein